MWSSNNNELHTTYLRGVKFSRESTLYKENEGCKNVVGKDDDPRLKDVLRTLQEDFPTLQFRNDGSVVGVTQEQCAEYCDAIHSHILRKNTYMTCPAYSYAEETKTCFACDDDQTDGVGLKGTNTFILPIHVRREYDIPKEVKKVFAKDEDAQKKFIREIARRIFSQEAVLLGLLRKIPGQIAND